MCLTDLDISTAAQCVPCPVTAWPGSVPGQCQHWAKNTPGSLARSAGLAPGHL